ncbi:pyruvate kinase-like protein [Xylariales sp. PMI_506]|nr:pyruvate kinase-like protein [Xylariales sp. PMI_506]
MGSLIVDQLANVTSDDAAPLPPRDVLLSLRTGKIRPLGGAKVQSAINKSSRQGRVEVTKTGLVGDEQQYVMHGGVDKALHMYCSAHYDTWNKVVPNRQHLFKIGGFGENLSAALLTENNVCIGDVFRLGPEVILEVSEPRQPCSRLNHRFEYKKASSEAQNSGRTGWYLRVLKTGSVQEGDEFELINRPNPRWSITQMQKYLYHDMNNYDAMLEISQLPQLGDEIVQLFRNRLAHQYENMNRRLEGTTPIRVIWHPYKLVEKVELTPRVKTFVFEVEQSAGEIEDADVGRFPHVRLKFGPDLTMSRAYSVVAGDMRRFELGIARDDQSRGGSIYMHEKVQVGDVLQVAKGTNANNKPETYSLDKARAMKHIFIIGGIGVTAFLSEIKSLSQASADIEIHYAVRSRKEAAYIDHLPAQHTTIYAKDEGKRLELHRIVPNPIGESGHENWIYCCGPASLLGACQALTRKNRYPRSQVHFEEFGGAATGTGNPFEAEIRSTGQVLQVPKDKSLLQILNGAGFDIESSCLVGNCGTCMVDYCNGEIEHRGLALEEEQKSETMLACVSRGKGRIVIDF